MLAFGIPGSGKTRFFGSDPKTAFLATEPGQDFVKAPVFDIRKWAGDIWQEQPTGRITTSFKKIVHVLAEHRKANSLAYSSVVVDIVDNLQVLCQDSVCANLGVAHPSEKKDFGKTWGAVTKEWTLWIRALMDITNVRFISHCVGEEIEVENENKLLEEVTRYRPTFSSSKAAQYLDGVVNAVGFFTKSKDGRYILTFVQDARTAAKDRTDILTQLGPIDITGKDFNYVSDLYNQKAQQLGFQTRSKRGA